MATVGFNGRRDHGEVNAYLAHMGGVKKSVHDEGRDVKKRADALFKAHDNPGGHRITGERQDTDYIVSLEGTGPGDNPLAVEYGRGPVEYDDGRKVGPAEGLHILSRAARL